MADPSSINFLQVFAGLMERLSPEVLSGEQKLEIDEKQFRNILSALETGAPELGIDKRLLEDISFTCELDPNELGVDGLQAINEFKAEFPQVKFAPPEKPSQANDSKPQSLVDENATVEADFNGIPNPSTVLSEAIVELQKEISLAEEYLAVLEKQLADEGQAPANQ